MPPNQALQRAAIGIKCSAAGDLASCSPQCQRARVLEGRRAVAELSSYAALCTRLLAFLVLSLPAFAHSQERVIGLIEIPPLYPQEVSWDIELPVGTVVLRSAPSSSASVVLDVRNRRQVASAEHGYEEASARVYELAYADKDGAWFKLKYQDADKSGFGWFKAGETNQFHLTEDLLSEHMSYMTDSWDGRLRESPSSDAAATPVPKRWEGSHASARLITMWGSREDLWYLVAVMRGGNCSEPSEPPEVLATGWVPASTQTGDSPIWYYSRGC